MRHPRLVLVAAALLATGAVAATLVWRPWETAAAGASEIIVSTGGCGTGWTDPKAGRQTFQLHNVGSQTSEVQLVEVGSGKVYGEIDGLGPGTSAPMDVQLGAGDYAFRCLPEDVHAITGPTVKITGTEQGGPAVVPVSQNDLLGAVRQYHADVATGIDDLVTRTTALRSAVDAGNLDAARNSWLPAHLAYSSLGAAYDAFGDFADKIDGGFHQLEHALWHGEPAGQIADQLDVDVHGLRNDFPNQQIDPNDLGLRAHEIMENAAQFELTGENDQGSGTTLDTVLANLDGTTEVLKVLDPVLRPRYPELPGVMQAIDKVRSLLTASKTVPVAKLDRATRQKINGSVGDLLERLAPIAAICEVRRGS